MTSIQLLKFSIILPSFLFFASVSLAHNGGFCSRAFSPTRGEVLWPDAPKRPFDVQKYQLTLDWRKMFESKTPEFTGKNIITLLITQQTPTIELDAAFMTIDSISINGATIFPVPQPTSDSKLIISIPLSLRATGQKLVLSIGYNRNSVKDTGMYFFPKGTQDRYEGTNTTEDLAYTMSEPTDAHLWMPCMDQPYDKAESEISIIVPNGIEAASNGTLVSKTAYTPTSTIWNWKSDEPIATYLMVADASTFIHWGETHQRSSTLGDTVHLDYYAWPSDYYQDSIKDGSTYNAQYYLNNTSQIMTWLEARYGGFPFVKYGQVPVQPFSYGGMEHQSITTIHRRWLRGNDQGIAHEMAHQWFGDKTTCETFKDIWLNEGFATFSEAIWGESWGGNNQYMNILRGSAGWYLYDTASSKYAIYDPPEDDLFNYARTYCKGACVLHMLRRMVGNDTMFFGAMHDYSNAFAYTTANTAQFRDYMGPRLGIDLNEFIDEWIFTPLNPDYDIKWAQNANNMFYLRINQNQTVRDHFTMPVRIFALHGGLIDTLKFDNNSRSQGFQKSLSYKVDSIIFDNDAIILSTSSVSYAPELAVKMTSSSKSLFTIYRDGGELLCKFNDGVSSGTLELYNSVGMKISNTLVSTGVNQIGLDIHNLASGIYFIRYSNESMSEVQSVNIVR